LKPAKTRGVSALANYTVKAIDSGPSSTSIFYLLDSKLQTNATITVSSDDVDYSNINATTVALTFKNSPSNLTFSPGPNSFSVAGTETFSIALKPAYLSVPMTLIGNPEQNPAVFISRDSAEKITGVEIKGQTKDDSVDNSEMAKRIEQILEESEHIPDTVNIVH
jgi:hypothetical protein